MTMEVGEINVGALTFVSLELSIARLDVWIAASFGAFMSRRC